LESLFRQNYPQEDFEIIVVNDGSVDGTEKMLAGLLKDHPNLRYFSQVQKGPASARNLGLKEARADIIMFTDNDCIAQNNWVKEMVSAHKAESEVLAIGGLTRVDAHNIKAMVSQHLSDGAIQTAINGKQETIFFPTCNVSFKKQYLQERFNEMFRLPAGEDLELFWRLFKKGHIFTHNQDIEIFHDCHPGFRSFLRQAYMYGRGNYLAQHIHRDHPLLKEIKTASRLSFFLSLIINFIKIPRFSYTLGNRLIKTYNGLNIYAKLRIYFYFALHKILYLCGNISEYRSLRKISRGGPLLKELPNANSAPDKPKFIILDVTHRCNLKCNICDIRKDLPIEELNTEEIKDLIKQAMDWGVEEFVLSGGEPFVREDIFEVLDFVRSIGYHTGILTNGVLLTEDFINRILPYLVSNTLSLSISLDALTGGIHDDIRGLNGCFEKTLAALKTLSKLKKRHPGINFNTISIILNENLEELVSLANFLKSLGVNSIQFQPLLANNLIMKERSSQVKYWIRPERLSFLDLTIDKLIGFKKNNPALVINSVKNLLLVKKYFRVGLSSEDVACYAARKTMLIANNGKVTTCFNTYGDIRRQRLKSIWRSSQAAQARDTVSACKKPCLLPCFTDCAA